MPVSAFLSPWGIEMRRSAHVIGRSLGHTLRDVPYIKGIMEDVQEDVFVQHVLCARRITVDTIVRVRYSIAVAR
jgi:hypothetical protein